MGEVRIVSGRLKGRRLRVTSGVRPSGARLREALFSHWGGAIEGSVFFDLFAGSGAMALEAWSRGAERCVLFEGNRKVLTQLQKNCAIAGEGDVQVVFSRLPKDLERHKRDRASCDFAFADPPYDFRDYSSLATVVEPFLAQGATITLEHPATIEPSTRLGSLELRERRRYGDSVISIYGRCDGELRAPGS